MITYNRSAFGLNLILQLHGSAVYRAFVPSLLSVAVYFLWKLLYRPDAAFGENLGHPYAVGALVASASFLMVFRVNQGYARYWEGCSSVNQMMSKFMDASVHAAVYHFQCDHFKHIKPPSYFDYPELNHLYLTRDRERGVDFSDASRLSAVVAAQVDSNNSLRALTTLHHRKKVLLQEEKIKRKVQAVHKSINFVPTPVVTTTNKKKKIRYQMSEQLESIRSSSRSSHGGESISRSHSADEISRLGGASHHTNSDTDDDGRIGPPPINNQTTTAQFLERNESAVDAHGQENTPKSQPGTGKPFLLWGRPRLDGGWEAYYTQDPAVPLATFHSPQSAKNDSSSPPLPKQGFASLQGGRTPPLYLQELVHLSSLLVAVALSTLRNDIDGSESPLTYYEPGSPWPTLDPDRDYWIKVSTGWLHWREKVWAFLGMGRSPEEQTRYNAGRPLPVIGGVSDAEIRFLQIARGPYAKTQLCWNWLSEFMIREHLAGSMGKVGPPIVSRCFQFLGDGMIYYNHARKIMFIPFPFVHAQLAIIFILVLIPTVPFLMDQYTDDVWLGAVLSFFTVLCISGINEVARELENPFRNVPNELPLVTMMAQYNEALLTIYSGYHPDVFWNEQDLLKRNTKSKTQPQHQPQEDRTEKVEPEHKTRINGASKGFSFRTPKEEKNDSHPRLSSNRDMKPSFSLDESVWSPSSATSSRPPSPPNTNAADEMAQLKEQVAQQAKLIEQLFAQLGPPVDPIKTRQRLEEETIPTFL